MGLFIINIQTPSEIWDYETSEILCILIEVDFEPESVEIESPCQKSCSLTQRIAVPKFQRGFANDVTQATEQWEHLRPSCEEAEV